MKEPLLLIHGFTDTKATWAPVVPLLEPHHELLTPTLTGHRGGPPIPPDMTDPLATMADGLEQVIDDAGHERVHICGNSLGGWLAFMLAQRGRALSVVTLSPGHGWADDEPPKRVVRRFTRAHHLSPRAARYARKLAARPGLRRIAFDGLVAHPERIKPATAVDLIMGSAECPMFEPYKAQIERGGYKPGFGDLGVPARIAWGTKDRTLPFKACSGWFRDALPDAEWVDLPDCGHLPQHDDPELVTRAILEVTQGSRANLDVASA